MRVFKTASKALLIFAAETISIALVIFLVLETDLILRDISFVFGHYKLSGLEVDTKYGRRMKVVCIGENGTETGCNKVVCSVGRETEDITFQDVERVYGVYNFFNFKKGTLG